ncbi:MAG: RDD family protein [Thermomicrobium sp.]
MDPLIRERQATQEREAAQQRSGHRSTAGANPLEERAKGRGASTRSTTSDQPENTTSRHGSTGGAEPPGASALALRRLLAVLIDLFVFRTLSSGIVAVGNVPFVGDATGFIVVPADMSDRLYGFLSSAVPLLAGYFYWIYPVGRWGSTHGKRAASIKVVNTEGAAPGQAKALWRVLIAALLGWLLFLPWWSIPFRLDHRGLHDLAADVWVIVDPPA